MSSRIPRVVVALVAAAMLALPLVATPVASPGTAAGHGLIPSAAAPRERSADLTAALGTDGTFRGAPGVAGTVDTSAWTLVSDLAAGEPPRFAPAASGASSSPTGPWSALGSNGGELYPGQVNAIAVSGSDLYVGGTFTNAAGIATADYIAKWNGSAWSALGSIGAGDGAINLYTYGLKVDAIAVSGTDVYVGGAFNNVAGICRHTVLVARALDFRREENAYDRDLHI